MKMRGFKFFRKKQIVLLLILFATTATEALCQNVDTILLQYFEASGGIQNIEKIQTSKTELLVWQNENLLGINPETTSIINSLKPNRHITYKLYPSCEKGEIRSPSGQLLLRYFCTPYHAGAIIRGQYVEIPERAGRRIVLLVPHLLLEAYKNGDLTYNTTEDFEGELCQKITGKNIFENNDHIEFYFSDSSKLLVGHTSKKNSGVIIYYEDYQAVGNLLIPFAKKSMRDGILFFRDRIEKIEFNLPLSEDDFLYKP